MTVCLVLLVQACATLTHDCRVHDATWTNDGVLVVGCDNSQFVVWSATGEYVINLPVSV